MDLSVEALNTKEEIKMKVAQKRVLRWMWCGVIRLNRIRNECRRRNLEIAEKMRKDKSRWYWTC